MIDICARGPIDSAFVVLAALGRPCIGALRAHFKGAKAAGLSQAEARRADESKFRRS